MDGAPTSQGRRRGTGRTPRHRDSGCTGPCWSAAAARGVNRVDPLNNPVTSGPRGAVAMATQFFPRRASFRPRVPNGKALQTHVVTSMRHTTVIFPAPWTQ